MSRSHRIHRGLCPQGIAARRPRCARGERPDPVLQLVPGSLRKRPDRAIRTPKRGLAGLHAKVRLPHLRVAEELAARARADGPPVHQDEGAVRHLQRLRDVLLDEEHGHRGLPDGGDDPEHLLDDNGCEAERRLVEHEQGRLAHQAPPDGAHLLLAAGEGPAQLPLSLLQPGEEREDPLEVRVPPLARAARVRAELEVVAHAHLRKERPPFRDVPDSHLDDAPGGGAEDRLAVELDDAFPRPGEPRDGAQGRRLPRAVRAQHHDELSALRLEAHVPERLHVAVTRRETRYAEESSHMLRCAYFVPRYAFTTSGWRITSSGGPAKSLWPKSRTTTRSEIFCTACITCSIPATAAIPSERSRFTSSIVSSTSAGVSPAITSSRRMMRGRSAIARATSSRLRPARVSERASLRANLARPVSSRISCARCSASRRVRSLASAATATFSSVVSAGNGRTIWKVRPMPSCAVWLGRRPRIDFPSKRISPVLGASAPVITLKRVVFPAPFGPMTLTILSRGTSNETWSRARRPSKDLETSRISRRGPVMRPGGARARGGLRACSAGRSR